MQIGIVDYLLRVREEACFYMAAQLGFECLELTAEEVANPSELLFSSMRSIDELTRSSGIPVRSIYGTYFLTHDLFCSDDRQRQSALAALRCMVRTAVHYKIPTVVVPMFGASYRDERSDRVPFDLVFANVLSWEEMSQTRIALKTTIRPDRLKELIDRHPAHQLGVCFDPANCAPLHRDVAEEVRKLSPRIFSVHLKDRTLRGESIGLGQGTLHVSSFLQALDEIGYAGPVILETPAGRSAVDSARRNLEAYRRLAA